MFPEFKGGHLQRDSLAIRVEHQLGAGREKLPKIVYLGEREIHVLDIIDRWIDNKHRYYKTRGSDQGIYLLHYDVISKNWDLTLFDCGKCQETKLSST